MANKRTKLRLSLAILAVVAASIWIVLAWSRATSSRLLFERIHEEMTIDEVFGIVHQNPNKCVHDCAEFGGVEIDDFMYESEWWIIPRYEYRLNFVFGRLVRSEMRAQPLSQSWRELLGKLGFPVSRNAYKSPRIR